MNTRPGVARRQSQGCSNRNRGSSGVQLTQLHSHTYHAHRRSPLQSRSKTCISTSLCCLPAQVSCLTYMDRATPSTMHTLSSHTSMVNGGVCVCVCVCLRVCVMGLTRGIDEAVLCALVTPHVQAKAKVHLQSLSGRAPWCHCQLSRVRHQPPHHRSHCNRNSLVPGSMHSLNQLASLVRAWPRLPRQHPAGSVLSYTSPQAVRAADHASLGPRSLPAQPLCQTCT